MDLSQLIKLKNKNLILKNVDNTPLGIINARDIVFSPRFNGLSSISFVVDKKNCEVFDMITSYKLVELQGVGTFIIENPSIINDGKSRTKTVTCRSYEIDINRKTIPYLNGVYKFYSPISTDETIMKIILSYLPNWSIESIDSSLWNTYRYFELTDIPLYQFIIENVSNSLECVFLFNTLNKTIKVVAYENILKSSDIYLSLNNLVNSIEITEDTESLCTALTVKGAGNLDITLANPLGTNTIYNFDHFLNSVDKKTGIPFMSNELKLAINGWQDTINSYQTIYANYLTSRATKLSELITLQSQLTTLESELKTLEITRDALLESSLNATAKNTEVKNKRNEISAKKTEVDSKQSEINIIDSNLQAIHDEVAFEKYFTTEQILQIEPYIIQKSVTDENFIAGSEDSLLDIQNTAQELYNKYKRWIDSNSKLQYDFSIDLINFIGQEEYSLFTNQLSWGVTVTLDNGDNTVSYPMLQGLDIPLSDSNDNVQFIFGTKMRFLSATDTYENFLSNQVSNTVNSVAGSSVKWGEYVNSGNRDKIEALFKQGLQADLTEVSNSSNQEVVINSTGLMGRKLLEDGSYDDRQWKMINNKLIFTDDNWNTAKLAIGQINLPSGGTGYGINTQILMGNLILGNQMIISNESNTFIVDKHGALLENAVFSLIGNDGKNRILIDPVNGFKIQKLTGETWNDVVYLDSEGNAIFDANVDVRSININNNFIVDELGNVSIQGTLDINDGSITVDETGELVVEGDITANDLNLYIDGVKTSIIDELTGKIDGQYITGGMSGTTALGNLLVDNLSTSDKIRNYLASDTSQVNYIRIYDQYIEFVEATYAGGTTQARTGDKTGDLLYWTDDTYNFVTSITDGTLEPVMVYNYTELIKGKYGYEMVGGVNQPTIILGAGSGNIADSGKTFMYKGVDGFYIDYRHSVTGASTIFKITDNGIDFSQFPQVTYSDNVAVTGGMIQIWVQPDIPANAKVKDVWVDTDDYSRYDKTALITGTTLTVDSNEFITANGNFTITLHVTTQAGIIKKIYNIGTGIITVAGTINGKTNMLLYPDESIELITDGTAWRC